MQPTAKLAFAANKPPYLSGTEDALKSRMIVVPFDLKLEEHGTDGTVSTIDWQLKEKLASELPGILNRCLEALRGFVRRTPRKIHRASVSYHAMNEIMRDSDPVEAWIQDSLAIIKLDEQAPWVKLNDLYENYKADSDDEYTNAASFSRKVRQKLDRKIEIIRGVENGKKFTFIRGVVLRDDAKITTEF